MRVELTEEFDKNFERKAFFTDKWKKRANPNAKDTLLMVRITDKTIYLRRITCVVRTDSSYNIYEIKNPE
ncbi:MAG: hypothetical protein J6Q47_00540 [Paludibacteraceae bacterium]|nr:hypothetical protein [Paludibacteraceae bacterium]